MKQSLKLKIFNRLNAMEGKWVHKERIAERAKEWGYMSVTGIRRVQELAEDGIIQKKEENGTAYYRYEENKIKKEEQDQIISLKTQTLGFNQPTLQTTLW